MFVDVDRSGLLVLTDVSTTFFFESEDHSTGKIVETSVNINIYSPSKDSTNLDDLLPQTKSRH